MPDKGAICCDSALASHLQHELQFPVFFLRWGKHRQRKESKSCPAMFSASFKFRCEPVATISAEARHKVFSMPVLTKQAASATQGQCQK